MAQKGKIQNEAVKIHLTSPEAVRRYLSWVGNALKRKEIKPDYARAHCSVANALMAAFKVIDMTQDIEKIKDILEKQGVKF